MKLVSVQSTIEPEYCTITDGINSIRLKQFYSLTPQETREVIQITKERKDESYPQDLFEQEVACVVLQHRADVPLTKLEERVNAGDSSLLVEEPSGFEEGDTIKCGGKEYRIVEIQGNKFNLGSPVDIAIAKRTQVCGVVNLEALFSNIPSSSLVKKIYQFYQSEANFGKGPAILSLTGMKADEVALARGKEIKGYVIGIGREYIVFSEYEDIPDKLWQQIQLKDGRRNIDFFDFSEAEKKGRKAAAGKN